MEGVVAGAAVERVVAVAAVDDVVSRRRRAVDRCRRADDRPPSVSVPGRRARWSRSPSVNDLDVLDAGQRVGAAIGRGDRRRAIRIAGGLDVAGTGAVVDRGIVAVAAGEGVVAGAAVEGVVAVAAVERVVAASPPSTLSLPSPPTTASLPVAAVDACRCRHRRRACRRRCCRSASLSASLPVASIGCRCRSTRRSRRRQARCR